jgi:lipopolysaccharide export system protein LptA
VGTFLFLNPLARLSAQTTRNPPAPNQTITLLSDVQEADSKTGIVTATGNVQVFYPARGITGTSTQAQYFSRERRIIMTGNVHIVQEGGNTIDGEVVTYLVDEERFIAVPQAPRQVQSVYVIQDEAQQSNSGSSTSSNSTSNSNTAGTASTTEPQLIPDLPL